MGLDHLGSGILAVPPPTPCAPPAFSLVAWGEEQKRPWPCVSVAQQQVKHLCYQYCFQFKSKIIAHASPILLEKLTLPKPAEMISCLYSDWGIVVAKGQLGMWNTCCRDDMVIGPGDSSGMVDDFLSSWSTKTKQKHTWELTVKKWAMNSLIPLSEHVRMLFDLINVGHRLEDSDSTCTSHEYCLVSSKN